MKESNSVPQLLLIIIWEERVELIAIRLRSSSLCQTDRERFGEPKAEGHHS